MEPQAVVRRNRRNAAAAVLGIVIIGGLIGARLYTEAIENQILEDAVIIGETNGGSVERPELTPEQVEDFDNLLDLAELQFSMLPAEPTAEEVAYLLSEGPNNVVQLTDTVLAVDPGYEGAVELKERAFDTIVERAQELRDEEDFVQALSLARGAAAIFPNSATVVRLTRNICSSAPDGVCDSQ